MKFGIIKERKDPPDKRVVLSPEACKLLLKKHEDLEIKVESSDVRTFKDKEYAEAGVEVTTDISDCDVLLGVKEVPLKVLIPNKKYFFFSHTIKKQSYNRDLLGTILYKNIELYDHEVITSSKGIRLVAFGRYAGIVGAYNTLRTYGLKMQKYELPSAEHLRDQAELVAELRKISLPNIKIAITGTGRVSNGVKEILDAIDIKQVSPNKYLNKSFNTPVYTQLDVLNYNKRKDGRLINEQDFFDNATAYQSDFMRFAKVSDVYIASHFYGEGAPFIFTREDAKHPDFKIQVVGDISCDIDGPVASTIRSSTIADPNYGYDPMTEKEVDFLNPKAIAVMAVDNLPCELPRDSSVGFSKNFVEHVIPAFFDGDSDGILERSCMTKNGKLTPGFSYLQDYLDGKDT
jgi:alanine dehydrogenase